MARELGNPFVLKPAVDLLEKSPALKRDAHALSLRFAFPDWEQGEIVTEDIRPHQCSLEIYYGTSHDFSYVVIWTPGITTADFPMIFTEDLSFKHSLLSHNYAIHSLNAHCSQI